MIDATRGMAVARHLTVALLGVGLCLGQANAPNSPISERLLAFWGGAAGFSPAYRQSLDAFFSAEDAYRASDYATASRILDAFWASYPAGGRQWALGVAYAQNLARTSQVNFGSPGCYYALRMLTECVNWRLQERNARAPGGRPIRLTVLLAGKSNGVQPASMEELKAQAGREVHHSLEPALASDEIIRESLFLFTEYIRAMTGGHLKVEVKIARFPNLDVPVHAGENTLQVAGGPRTTPYANLAPGAMEKIWSAVPDEVRSATDWWWILYPSHVPEQYPEFRRTEFVTGGMATGPDGRSPAFVIDDRWLVRSPPHLGDAPLTPEERRVFLPQWFQHEFFHHLYRTYPELKLETVSHQWFDRKLWPPDFEGWTEADYYAESLHKRLQSARPPLWVTLRYAPPAKELLAKITPQMLRGKYRAEPVANEWMEGVIEWNRAPGTDRKQTLRWINHAGVSWLLVPDLNDGLLSTGTDNPYYEREPVRGRAFRVVLRRDGDGEYVPEVAGFQFLGSFYEKVPLSN